MVVFLPHVGLPIGVGRVDISTILSAGSAIELGCGVGCSAAAALCALLPPAGCLLRSKALGVGTRLPQTVVAEVAVLPAHAEARPADQPKASTHRRRALFALAATATTIMSALHGESTKTEVILVRHGECEMNLEVADKVGGRASASPLTAKGEAQASKLGRWLRSRGVRFDRVVASTAVRAKRTAELMLAEMDDPPQLELDSNLEEMTQGDWEGQPRSECYNEKTCAAIDADPRGFAAPGGESKADVEARAVQAIEKYARAGERTCIVNHGIVAKCFLRHVLQSDWASLHEVGLENTGLMRFARNRAGRWRVESVNETPHL